MEEAIFVPSITWGWNCPNCGGWNDEEDDPIEKEHLKCDSSECGHKFRPVEGDPDKLE